jgi:hypothetical protein
MLKRLLSRSSYNTTKKSPTKVNVEALELKEKFQLMDLQLKKAKKKVIAVAQKVGMLKSF